MHREPDLFHLTREQYLLMHVPPIILRPGFIAYTGTFPSLNIMKLKNENTINTASDFNLSMSADVSRTYPVTITETVII